MGKKNFFLAAALAAAVAGAQANPTYHFEIRGSGLYAAGGWEGCSPSHPEECIHNTDWRGVFTVETASSADGTYTLGYFDDNFNFVPGGIRRLTLDSNTGYFDISGSDLQPGVYLDPYQYQETITIAGNQVTALELTYASRFESLFVVDGFSATWQSNVYHGGFADVSGTLTPIPEPGGISLSLLGLAAVALGIRRAGVKRVRGSSQAV